MARRGKSKKSASQLDTAADKCPLLYIEWLDHHANGAWQDKVDHTPAICQSYGILVKEDRRAITIAGSFSPGPDTFGNTQYILKNCIIKKAIVAR